MKKIKNLEKTWRFFCNFINRGEKSKSKVKKNKIVKRRKKDFLDLTDYLDIL